MSNVNLTVAESTVELSVDSDGVVNITAGDGYQLTAEALADLTDGGESTLHYHASDRDRSNHTGTQTASTISDFESAVEALANLIIIG